MVAVACKVSKLNLQMHNLWLEEELKGKVKNLADLRKANMDEESQMLFFIYLFLM